MNELSFDFIISGAGCAGLSLLVRMIGSGKFADKKILVVDQSLKNQNDRTWCFWEKGKGYFEPVVYKDWRKLWFYSDGFSCLKDIFPYRYKMIRGVDFYSHCLEIIRRQPNIEFLQARIEGLVSNENETCLLVNGKKIYAKYIFNSILFEKPVLKKNDFYLLQHFKGWLIETRENKFNPEEAVLMDFRVRQDQGTAFVYTMPFSEKRALIEYTLFTENLLLDSAYDNLIKLYIRNVLGIAEYEVKETEFGIIPMTTHNFPANDHHIVHLGMAGGQTRASTGYTFQFIQKQTSSIVNKLLQSESPVVKGTPGRFRYYDRLFLDVLNSRKNESPEVFARLFGRNQVTTIFDFLDCESSLIQDFMLINSMPVKPFLKAAIRHAFAF